MQEYSDKSKVCVVIPIYNKELNDTEIYAINRCINNLKGCDIYFMAPSNLDITFYNRFKQ